MIRTVALVGLAAISSLLPRETSAQAVPHDHTAGMQHAAQAGPAATQGGQAAYAAIAEVVRLLEADPATDWSTVNLEALRQHLIDMDAVTLQSAVVTTPIEGGIEVVATGGERVAAAIRRMARAHGEAMASESPYRLTVTEVPNGARVRIVAAADAPAPTAEKIRGLGFIGIMASGNHHAVHHMAIARGASAGHVH